MKISKSFLALGLFFAMSLQTFANFNDVDNSELYFKGIKYLQDNGIVNGYEDGTFKPHNEVNRAEMLKIVIEAKEIPEANLAQYAGESCFQDVPADVWYTKYVCYAKAQGWVGGYDNGKNFRPGASINTVEALKIVLEIWGIEYPQNPNIWYKGVVDRAAESNYIPLNTVDFGANVHRDQMADMISRIINDDAGTLADYLGPRSVIVADYSTIQRAINGTDWDVDPNHNALIITTILTSQVDDEKAFTILDVENAYANDPSLTNIPKTLMYADEFNTYYYISSAVCILDGSCSETQIAKLDEILTESEQAADAFSLGEKEKGDGCYFVSPWDFQTTLPLSWGAIHDFTMLDIAYWEDVHSNAGAYTGQGVVCDGVIHENNSPDFNDNIIRIQGK